MSDFDDAMAAGVVRNRAEFDALGRALDRADLMALDNLGIRVRAPEVPHPEPDPTVLRKLQRMYGVLDSGDSGRGLRYMAAVRTAVAMERRRQGWTREGAREEWARRWLAAAGEQAERAAVGVA